eukprot:1849941-Pyramimonas_sp.AAC.1
MAHPTTASPSGVLEREGRPATSQKLRLVCSPSCLQGRVFRPSSCQSLGVPPCRRLPRGWLGG